MRPICNRKMTRLGNLEMEFKIDPETGEKYWHETYLCTRCNVMVAIKITKEFITYPYRRWIQSSRMKNLGVVDPKDVFRLR